MPKPNFETCKQCHEGATEPGLGYYGAWFGSHNYSPKTCGVTYTWDRPPRADDWSLGRYIYRCPALNNNAVSSLYSNDNVPASCPYLLQHMEAECDKANPKI